MKKTDDFTDAERVLAGKEPLSEKWKSGEVKVEKKEEIVLENVDKNAYVAPKSIEKKTDKKKEKKEESAGISPAERDELEKLKTEIVSKKMALKEQGLSGGQQNKDPDVVKMVARMQELKVKSGEISGDAKADKKAAKGKGPKGDRGDQEADAGDRGLQAQAQDGVRLHQERHRQGRGHSGDAEAPQGDGPLNFCTYRRPADATRGAARAVSLDGAGGDSTVGISLP